MQTLSRLSDVLPGCQSDHRDVNLPWNKKGERKEPLFITPLSSIWSCFLSELISYSLNCLSNFQFKVQSIPQLPWFFLIPLVICLERSHHLFNQRNASWSPAFSRALGQVAGYHAQFLSAFSQYFSFLWLGALITFVLFSRLFIQKLTISQILRPT